MKLYEQDGFFTDPETVKKKSWKIVQTTKNDEYGYCWFVEYSEKTKEYRVSYFKDNHFQDEIIFKEVDNEY